MNVVSNAVEYSPEAGTVFLGRPRTGGILFSP